MKLNKIRRSVARAMGGVWRDFVTGEVLDKPHEEDRLCLLVAERDNPKYRAARAKALIELRDEFDGENAGKAYEEIHLRAMSEAVLLGWANLEGEDGQVVDYSPGTAFELLSDPELFPLRQFVEDVSGIGPVYRKELEDAAVGNS